MIHQNYVPAPIDTTHVEVPRELTELGEYLAKNIHEIWAMQRMEQGWTYGEERDDVLKHHPCLVPYEDLPEVEKDYDRDTAMGTLRLIVKSGFRISKD